MKKSLLLSLFLMIIGLSSAQHTDILSADQNNYIQTFGGGMGKNTFFKFDIGSIPSNAIITNVRFNGYIFNSQPAWDGDMKYIRYNNQTWLETDSNQYIWNTSLFTDTVDQLIGFGPLTGFSQSPDLSPLFMVDFTAVNSYFSFFMKDPDDPTCCPMMPGASFTNTDSLLVGNIFNNHTAFRPRLYSNPNQRPYLAVSYNIPPSTFISPGGIFCEENDLILAPSISGDGPLVYQWLLDGAIMPGENNDTLFLNSLAMSDSGHYSIIVTNPFGVDTSNQSYITISPLNINSLGNDTTVCYSDPLVLDAGFGYVSYTWSPGGATTQTFNADTANLSSDTTIISVTVLKLDGCFSYDTVTVILDPCGAGVEEIVQNFYSYPNPHEGIFNLTSDPLKEDATIEILNLHGETIRTFKLNTSNAMQNIIVDISDAASGIYFIRFKGKNLAQMQKTIKR